MATYKFKPKYDSDDELALEQKRNAQRILQERHPLPVPNDSPLGKQQIENAKKNLMKKKAKSAMPR